MPSVAHGDVSTAALHVISCADRLVEAIEEGGDQAEAVQTLKIALELFGESEDLLYQDDSPAPPQSA